MTSAQVNILLLSFLAAILLCEIARGVYSAAGARAELRPNLGSAVTYLFLTKVLYYGALMFLLSRLVPQWRNGFAALPAVPLAIGATLIDDYLNYWAHRLAHKIPWFWRLHKPHHALKHLNATVTISGNVLYSFVLPSSWSVPLLVYLGAPGPALFLQALKIVGAINQHSDLRWDLWLRRWALTRWLVNGLERVFVMQDFHHAHHGIGRNGRSAGNFGNIFSLFDWLHGTGRLPHAIQERFGLPDGVAVEPWYVRVWWPIFRTKESADLRVPTEDSVRYSSIELAAARAVIITCDNRAIAVA